MVARGGRSGAGGDAVDRRSRAERRDRADRRGPDRRHRDRRRRERRLPSDRRLVTPGRSGPPDHDARTDRGDETRTALARAVLESVDAGDPIPGMTQVARTVGVTPRLVHHHFGSHHDLVVAATTLQQFRSREWLHPAEATDPLERRVAHTVRSRRALHRALGSLHLAVAAHPAGRGLDEPVLRSHRARLRDQLAATFARELAREARVRSPEEADTLLDALHAVAGWAGWWPTIDGADRARALARVARTSGISRRGDGPVR